ncbi:putative glycolipid-binding domain-containing protein [Rugosimonospora acidiphila]|uniref:Glycolipid-binding domain-containing protein n=1 Tax=Rugosimonospora acidiphila TaxID=556531 RepID=A0ABP9RGK9_9ACTN
MPVSPRSLLWQRIDTDGIEHVLFDDRSGLYARGTMVAAAPVPYTCDYELLADPKWSSVRLTVTAEGAGWLRSVKLERPDGRWHVTAGEQGNLDAALVAAGHPRAGLPGSEDPGRLLGALDVDLGYCPLANTLPIRRLGLLSAPPGTAHTITAAWVLVPELVVVPARQTYTLVAPGSVRYASGDFTADLTVDDEGFVASYPGLATRITG